MNVKITKTKPKNNLKSKPPHKVIRKILLDFLRPIFIRTNPIVKLSKESIEPSNIEINNNLDILPVRNNVARITNNIIARMDPKTIRDFSFLIISGFLNRFDKSVQACENTKK
jgi:hypothetical protein